MSDRTRIVLDIGGSSIKSGRVRGREVSDFRIDHYDSRGTGERIVAAYRRVLRVHLDPGTGDSVEDRVEEVVLAHPGPFDYERGISLVRGVAKLEGLYGTDLRAALAPDLPPGCFLRFLNDAAAAIRGEARHGAGRGCRRLIGVTLGTGFGSAFVIDGEVVREGEGVAGDGELFHLPWRAGIADECFSSRGLLARLARDGFRVRAVRDIDGERHAECLAAFGLELGTFLAPIATAFRAEAVLVLGGIANLFPRFGPALKAALPVPARRGELGPHAPLLGA